MMRNETDMSKQFFLACLLILLFASPGMLCAVEPYGAGLFQGNFAGSGAGSVVRPGDRVLVRLWGGEMAVDDTFTVDSQGRIVLPELGAVPVGGLAREKLAEALRSKLNVGGRGDTRMYVSFPDAGDVSVLVTGRVAKPGRYGGQASDPLLSFLDKAGGIDPESGSYRDIRLMRQGTVIAVADLYPFARRGELAPVRLQDGDTLVVPDRGPVITATGTVRTPARFEFRKGEATGGALMDLAEPEPRTSHVAITGTRDGAPYNTYLPVGDLRGMFLEDGDQLQFMADATGGTIMVEVQGAVRGSSRFPVRRGASLGDVRHFIAVDPEQADLRSMHIKRRSVARSQKKAIADSLRRLEESAMTASSESSEESQIRAREAEMIAKFVERAGAVEPEGVVVLDNGPDSGRLVLEDGDVIVIPARTDVVLVSGEVMAPKAMLWSKDKTLDDYVRGAGGYSSRADTDHVLVTRPNGAVSRGTGDIGRGDHILVLPRVQSKNMQAVKDISQVLMQVAVSTGTVLGLPFLKW